jgi:hypothetical protein
MPTKSGFAFADQLLTKTFRPPFFQNNLDREKTGDSLINVLHG